MISVVLSFFRALAAEKEKFYAMHLKFLGSVIRVIIYIIDRYFKKQTAVSGLINVCNMS